MRPNLWKITLASLAAAVCTLAIGCQPAKTTVGGAPATPQRLEELRTAYVAQQPGTIVGPVIAVMTEQRLAAIGDVPPDRFAEGDLISIIDSRENTIALGRVVRRLADTVHIRYEAVPNTRAVMEGDVAVRLPNAGAALP